MTSLREALEAPPEPEEPDEPYGCTFCGRRRGTIADHKYCPLNYD